MDPVPPVVFSSIVGPSVGVLEFGLFIGIILFGINILQVRNYFRWYPSDRWWFKAIVLTILMIDLANTGMEVHAAWYYTIDLYGNPLELGNVSWSLEYGLALAATVVFLTQSFFSFRVGIVTQSRLFGITCFLLSLLAYVFTITLVGLGIVYTSLPFIAVKYRWVVICELGWAAVADATIAIGLCVALLRSRNAFGATAKMLDRLITYTVCTGLITGVLAIVSLVCFLTMSNMVWCGIVVVVAKLYPVCLLASLNARAGLRKYTGNAMSDHGQQRKGEANAEPSYDWSTPQSERVQHTTQTSVYVDIVPPSSEPVEHAGFGAGLSEGWE